MTVKGVSVLLKLAVIISVFALVVSCSGSGRSPDAGKPPAKANLPKAPPAQAASKAQQGSPSADWVAFGLDKEGARISYDRRSVRPTTDRKAVAFWLLVTPVKDSKTFTEAQEQLKKEGKDYQSLVSVKTLCDANCGTMTYDISKTAMVKADGATILEQDAAMRDRKPGPEVKILIEKLCSGVVPGPLPKGVTPTAQAACEKAGIMVLIQPPDAVAAGAGWRIEGGEWKKSGEKVCDLPVDAKSGKGTYRIEYKDIPDSPFATPEAHNAVVSAETRYSFYNTEYFAKAAAQKR